MSIDAKKLLPNFLKTFTFSMDNPPEISEFFLILLTFSESAQDDTGITFSKHTVIESHRQFCVCKPEGHKGKEKEQEFLPAPRLSKKLLKAKNAIGRSGVYGAPAMIFMEGNPISPKEKS